MPRKDLSPSISFFSFQDIITSVTGIMFLVMLILTLMLLTRHRMEQPVQQKETEEIRALHENIQLLKDQIVQILAQSQEMQQRIEELKKLDAKSIPIRRQEAQQKLVSLKNTLEALRKKQDETQNTITEVTQQSTAAAAEISEKEKTLATLEAEKQKKTETKDRLETEKKNASRIMRFTWAKNISQKPILVECAATYIRAGSYNSDVPQVEFTCGTGANEQANMRERFFIWARKHLPSETYFVLLAKPSGFENVEYMAHFLGLKGFLRGREILPNDDVVVFRASGGKP